MKIAFVHYHLKTGGVTTVIKQQIQSIQPTCEVLTTHRRSACQPFSRAGRLYFRLGI